jgi:hypothetical protein
MALAPWHAMEGGKFQSKETMEMQHKSGENLHDLDGAEQTEEEIKYSEALAKVTE